MSATVVFYISGHGFGHASRQIEIVNALGALAGAPRIAIRTAAAPWLFERTVRVPHLLLPGETDTGVVQIDSLHLDERATIEDACAFHATFESRMDEEARLLVRLGARLVVCDAPPLACAAAAGAGIPAIVISNFTWDWIYDAYRDAHPATPELVHRIGAAYARASAGWRLPMFGGFETIPEITDLPFVARHARHERAWVRRVLGLPDAMPLVLWSFGGYGLTLDLARLDCLGEFGLVMTGRGEAAADARPGVFVADERLIYERELRYEDLVAAVDVVLTKPGYGIVSECIANGTAMLYASRGHFAEYDVMVREMPRYLRCREIGHDDLFAGRWRQHLEALMAQAPASLHPATDGASVAAAGLLARIA